MDEPADESNHAMLLRQETPRDSDQTIRSLCGNYLEWRIYRHPTCQDDPGGILEYSQPSWPLGEGAGLTSAQERAGM